jgi:periodic tryptophan protein 1
MIGQLTWSCALLRAFLQVDVRSPTAAALVWGVSADVEALAWNPDSPTCFLVSSEDGIVAAFDARGGAGGRQCWQQAQAGRCSMLRRWCTATEVPACIAAAPVKIKLRSCKAACSMLHSILLFVMHAAVVTVRC